MDIFSIRHFWSHDHSCAALKIASEQANPRRFARARGAMRQGRQGNKAQQIISNHLIVQSSQANIRMCFTSKLLKEKTIDVVHYLRHMCLFAVWPSGASFRDQRLSCKSICSSIRSFGDTEDVGACALFVLLTPPHKSR